MRATVTGSVILDPRPDLREDSHLWEYVLANCRALEDVDDPGSLYGALDGVRCLGARLAIVNGRARLFRGAIGEEEYEQLRRMWLEPHHEKLVRLLSWLDETGRGACGGR